MEQKCTNFLLDTKTREKIDEIALKTERSRGAVIRFLLKEKIAEIEKAETGTAAQHDSI